MKRLLLILLTLILLTAPAAQAVTYNLGTTYSGTAAGYPTATGAYIDLCGRTYSYTLFDAFQVNLAASSVGSTVCLTGQARTVQTTAQVMVASNNVNLMFCGNSLTQGYDSGGYSIVPYPTVVMGLLGWSAADFINTGIAGRTTPQLDRVATPVVSNVISSGALVSGTNYQIVACNQNAAGQDHFYPGCQVGDIFCANATTALDANNTVSMVSHSSNGTPVGWQTLNTGTCTAGKKYYIVKTSDGRFGGHVAGEIFTASGGETIDVNNIVTWYGFNVTTLTASSLYYILSTETDHFGTGKVARDIFTAVGTETVDPNNIVLLLDAANYLIPDRRYAINSYSDNILIIWEVGNDLADPANNMTPATAYSNLQTFCTNRKAAAAAKGVTLKVIILSVTPRGTTNHYYGGLTFNQLRNQVNGDSTTNGTFRGDFNVATASAYVFGPRTGITWADLMVDVGAMPNIGADADTAITTPSPYPTYQQGGDQTHLTNSGYNIMAHYVQAAILQLWSGKQIQSLILAPTGSGQTASCWWPPNTTPRTNIIGEGLMFEAQIPGQVGNYNSSGLQIGYGSAATGEVNKDGLYFYPATRMIKVVDGSSTKYMAGLMSMDTNYKGWIFPRTLGAYYLVQGGLYTQPTLIWAGGVDNTAVLYPGVSSGTLSWYGVGCRKLRRLVWPVANWMAPLVSDSFTHSGTHLLGTYSPDGAGHAATTGVDVGGTSLTWINTWSTWNSVTNAAKIVNPSYGSVLSTGDLVLGKWYMITSAPGANHFYNGNAQYDTFVTTSTLNSTVIDGTNQVKELTYFGAPALIDMGVSDYVMQVTPTPVAQTQAGVILACDSSNNPQSFVIAYIDALATHLLIDQYVSGTRTNLASLSYNAGQVMRVSKIGSKVMANSYTNAGAIVTIDSSLINNTLVGLWGSKNNTSSAVLNNFAVWKAKYPELTGY